MVLVGCGSFQVVSGGKSGKRTFPTFASVMSLKNNEDSENREEIDFVTRLKMNRLARTGNVQSKEKRKTSTN